MQTRQLRSAGLLVAAWLILGTACSRPGPRTPPAPWPGGQLVDLSHPYDAQTIFWPTAEPFRLEKVAEGVTPQGYYYAANNLSLAEHGGTHLDAPVHFAQGRWTTDQIPLDRLMGDAVVVDVSASCEADPDYQVAVQDLERWESRYGRIPDGSILLVRTGYAHRWPDAARYLGTAERGAEAVPKLHFPGIHPDAARWLVAHRSVKAVGIDTASLDYGQSTRYETHQVLYAQNIPGLENLAALDRLPPRGAKLIALPMKIAGGSGGPVRVVAILPAEARP